MDDERKLKTRPVRIVGNIRGGGEEEDSEKKWILLRNPNRVTISFPQQSTSRRKHCFELDYCYLQNEDTSLIYSNELRPLIPDIIHAPRHLTVFAYGAPSTGKTSTLSALAVLAIPDILSSASSLSISMYEVHNEQVLDLLDANPTPLQVLEDAQGRINLKGLSKVLVKSIQDFTNLVSQKDTLHPTTRSHKGLIFYTSSLDHQSKLNFVDLAGYEDSRRNNEDGLQITKNNKSLYGLFNVIHALNANDNHVPYRENKLARLLKESLTRNNHILMLNCLNPSFCQDTIHTLSLASRSCQRKTQMLMDSKKGIGCASKLDSVSSTRKETPVSAAKKASSISKERRIRNDVKPMKLKSPLGNVSAIKYKPSSITPSKIISEKKAPEVIPVSSSEILLDEKHDFLVRNDPTSLTSLKKGINKDPDVFPSGVNSENDVFVCQDVKENISFQTVGNVSPPLSEQIKTISENLKALCASAPPSLKMKELEPSCAQVDAIDSVEPRTPRTPAMQHHVKIEDRFETPIYNTPSGLFQLRSSGMKKSIVQEYLKFLNTASKEELKEVKGIGEKRSTYILELRENSPEPFKNLDDLENIGLSAKQIKGMVKNMAGALFN